MTDRWLMPGLIASPIPDQETGKTCNNLGNDRLTDRLQIAIFNFSGLDNLEQFQKADQSGPVGN